MPTSTRPLTALAAIALIEGLALLGYAVFLLVEGLRLGATGPAEVSNVPAIALQVALFAIFGAGLGWVTRGWWRGRRWARAPFLVAQLMALVIGIPLAQAEGSERWVGITFSLMAVLGIVLAFTPAVIRALDEE
ncbi:MAG: hypothetical protein WCP95_07475 [Actinomycetes bacterium]